MSSDVKDFPENLWNQQNSAEQQSRSDETF